MISQTPFSPIGCDGLNHGAPCCLLFLTHPSRCEFILQGWVHHVPAPGPEPRDTLTGVLCFLWTVFSYNTDSRPTCANSRHQCSVHAECRDFATGFCCSCVAGYTGNGRQCVAEGTLLFCVQFVGEKEGEWSYCFGAWVEILPLPRSLKGRGVSSGAMLFNLSFFLILPMGVPRGGLFLSCAISLSRRWLPLRTHLHYCL